MNRLITSAAVGAGAFVLLAGVAIGGYELRGPGTTVRTVSVTKTVPKTVTVIKWQTRTITKTVTKSSPAGTACVEDNGTVVPAVGAAVGSAPVVTCTIAILPDTPAANGDRLTLTAPDGTSSSYQLSSLVGG
jgi:hypothetical protein